MSRSDTGAGAVKRFVLLGAAGFVAPRHMRAIKETGHDLMAAMDPNDSVGILDSHFPDATFFTEFYELTDFVQEQADLNQPIDYFSVCSPNHLHEAHVTAGLRAGSNVICEKPLVLTVDAVDRLVAMETETPGHQHHPATASSPDHHRISGRHVSNHGRRHKNRNRPDVHNVARQLVFEIMERAGRQIRRYRSEYRHPFLRHAVLGIRPGAGHPASQHVPLEGGGVS